MAKQLEALLLKAAKTAASAPSSASKDHILSHISRELAVLGNSRASISTATMISNRSQRGFAISSIAEIMVQTRDHANARKLAQGKKGVRGWDSALFSVIREEIDQGYLDEARNSMTSTQDSHQRILLLVLLAGGYIKAGDKSTARTYLDEALALTPQLPLDWDDTPTIPRDEALVKIAGVQAESNDWQSAFLTADLIQRANYRAWALTEIAVRQINAADLSAALATADMLKESEYRSAAKLRIAKTLDASGKHVEAISILTTIPVDDEATYQARTSIALMQVKLGKHEEALETIESLRPQPSSQMPGSANPQLGRIQVLDQIIRAKAKSGDLVGAKNLVDELPPERQWLAIESIGRIWGGKEGMQQIVAAVERAAPGAKDCVLKLLALTYQRAGNHEEAVRSANMARKVINEFTEKDFLSPFSDPSSLTPNLVKLNRLSHYSELSELQTRINDLDGALTTLSLIDDNERFEGALSSIAFVLGNQRRPSALLDKIVSSHSPLGQSSALLGYVMGTVEALGSAREPLSPFGTQYCHSHYE